jgi:uncharacterized protein YbjT (DUF2867 family)
MTRRAIALLLAGLAGWAAPGLAAAGAASDGSGAPAPRGGTRAGVLLFGGTGRLGAPIAKLLVAAGEDVTVFVRADSSRERLAGLDLRYVVGDLADEKSIAAAFSARPYRVVIDASAQRGASNAVPRFYENAARWIAANARRTGVRQFILHGSIGAGDNAREVTALRGSGASDRLADKGRAETAVREGGVPYTIIRHGLVPYDPQPPATERAYLTRDTSTWGEVTRDDLAILTLDAMDNPARFNKVYHAIDPELRLRRAPGSEMPRSIGGPSSEERAGGATPVPGARDAPATANPDPKTTTSRP